MDPISIVVLVSGAVTAVGGYFGGKRMAAGQAITVAKDTVELLEAQIQLMQQRDTDKDTVIRALSTRVEMLEAMVLQRADLDQMKEDIRGIRVKLDA